MSEMIFVQLFGEGTHVWRPVTAEHIHDNLYRIIGKPPSADEVLAFKVGNVVRCRKQKFGDGATDMVAYEIGTG